MELEEWEYLSDDGFIDQLHHQDRKGKRVNPRENLSLQPNSLIDTEHLQKFIDPKKKSKIDPKGVSVSPNIVIPVPVEFDLSIPEPPKSSPSNDSVVEEVIPPESPTIPFQVFGSEPDQETVSSQVFFKKLKGNEFADMKLDSPKSSNRGLAPQIDLGKPQFEEKDEGVKSDEGCLFDFNENYNDLDQKECENDENHGGLNIWKMGMTGIAAVCSFGFACATIFVIALGTRRRVNKQQDQKLHFQVYTDEKRMEQVVHHATKLNDAISSAVRGVPLSRAHVAIGGYFDGL